MSNTDRMPLSKVPAYLKQKHQIEVTRQTVYNWVKKGKSNRRLMAAKTAGTYWTTELWINDFMANL